MKTRIEKIKEIQKHASGGQIYLLGDGKTANAIEKYLSSQFGISGIRRVVEDRFYSGETEKLSALIKRRDEEILIVFGFSDMDAARIVEDSIFGPNGINSCFLPFPFSFNESGEFINREYCRKQNKELSRSRALLDNDGKNIFDSYVEACITGDCDDLNNHREPVCCQYFKKGYYPTKPCVFFDVGAYTGDTVQFADTILMLKKYIGFEPETQNFERLKETLSKYTDVDAELLNCGLDSTCREIRFAVNGSSSGISRTGESVIKVVTLDSVASNIDCGECSFVKMDIEGAERDALAGASEFIKRVKPYLAISVYHRMDDLIVIPQMIERMCPENYDYSLGYYGNNYRELVLYAAPRGNAE